MRRVRLVGVALGALLGAVGGCEERRVPARYSVLVGRVIACQPATGELTVRVSRRTPSGPVEETLYCLVTRDSEIYVNDKLSSLGEIQIGDAVELIGRRESGATPRRFVIAMAYFERPLPPLPPPPPLASAPASAPTPPGQVKAQQQAED